MGYDKTNRLQSQDGKPWRRKTNDEIRKGREPTPGWHNHLPTATSQTKRAIEARRTTPAWRGKSADRKPFRYPAPLERQPEEARYRTKSLNATDTPVRRKATTHQKVLAWIGPSSSKKADHHQTDVANFTVPPIVIEMDIGGGQNEYTEMSTS